MAPIARTADDRFYYPIGKPPSKETIEAMCRAESNLEELWENSAQVTGSWERGGAERPPTAEKKQ
ncbi:hypothetical protein GGS23DRAFT_593156 [Durotheca rogersii]|uniref:uncharacterized protein n=1 Tax=Durotheca rogersii TaxID=419775 RepID=UPI00221EFEB1|nr:uncharacterized protein GGS23DRAFT_593156 [Durotheca rogersii]KAI5866403.1 hypothetical protein GGS23DRAFT_593156 [Durotheca rogersii]